VATEIIFAVQQQSECLAIPNCAFRVYFLFPLFFTPHLTDTVTQTSIDENAGERQSMN
jgi:hypothetical protein